MEGIRNFRSPGGIAVLGGTFRHGCVYRSGHLADATDGDLERLADLGVRTVVDLRSHHDIEHEGADRIPEGVTHHHLPIEDNAGRGRDIRSLIMGGDQEAIRAAFGGGRSLAMATDGAANFVRDSELAKRFTAALQVVLDPDNWPVLWHCSAGKDRAGWVGTVVLLAVEASTDDIVAHYLESNLDQSNTSSMIPEGEMRDMLLPFLLVQEEFVQAQLAAVQDGWASTEMMLAEGLGLSADLLGRFRAASVASAS